MADELLLACACGAVRGVAREVTPRSVSVVVCHCDDCQTFAHAIGRPDVLDAHGGTMLVQMSSGRLEIREGTERLACLQLTERGLVRWYTTCCRTPIGNTLRGARPPFVGVFRAFVAGAADGRPVEALTGPVRARVQTRWARGEVASDDPPIRFVLRAGRLMAGWWLRHGARSPLRDPSGAPRVPPKVLTPDELRDARTRAGF